MTTEKTTLREASRIEVISLVDNSVDFNSSSNKNFVQTFRQWVKPNVSFDLPIAENGFSVLIKVFIDDKIYRVLFDTGVSSDGVVINAKRMNLDLSELDYVVLSHGHYDHFGGLLSVLKNIKKPKIPLITHGDMFNPRGTANNRGEIRKHPHFPQINNLDSVDIINTKQPYFIADNSICITGEIPRINTFETGYNLNRIYVGNKWQPDPTMLDDRAIVFNLSGKGLVIISGCAHAGIINTINYAQKITKISHIYAVMGGFHLSGKEGEQRIPATITELKKFSPELIVPFHCTGWRATHALIDSFKDAFIYNSVGNLYQLK
jgi:7,8-dihydropterin-6-yl-methyl-4-(beta-D-ribofuranosyl)aminobenzene 5'-phosphate synthase